MVAVSLKKSFFQAEDGIRDNTRSRGLGDVYKRQDYKQFKLVTLGNYLPFKKIGNLIYVSGQLPIKDEKIISGKVPSETDIKEASYGSRICMLNTLSILDQLNPSCELSDFNCIHVAGYVNADHTFSDLSLIHI